ncbi:YceI family protein [Iamia sp.]|uniref:YceI family protein n=1 Tax=Iamia sp. TaxID=2722710 RepID=UPI002CEA95FE|nr:YceI family protein [Iamia sp.]HXH56963.1 YceI family protein [Iamia sp.]
MTDAPTLPTREFEGLAIPAPGAYTVDTSHSELTFSVRHMMVSKVRGRFGTVQGTIVFAEDPLASSVSIDIDVASIDTHAPDRDAHLTSADFFDAETFPTITFRSTGVSELRGGTFTLEGDLTVRDVTRPVSFTATYNGAGKNPWGQVVVGFEGRIELDREDFGLTWNQPLETGGVLVGKVVTIDIAIEAGPAT